MRYELGLVSRHLDPSLFEFADVALVKRALIGPRLKWSCEKGGHVKFKAAFGEDVV